MRRPMVSPIMRSVTLSWFPDGESRTVADMEQHLSCAEALGTVVGATADIFGPHMCTIGMDLTARCAASARVTGRYLDQLSRSSPP